MKTSTIQLRLTFTQKEAIRLAALRAHIDMSQWVLNRIFPKAQARFMDLLWQLKSVQDKSERAFILNDLNAFLVHLAKEDLPLAVAEDPQPMLNDLMQNYVAAMVERVCAMRNVEVPKWVMDCEGLSEPYFTTELASLRLYLLSASPPSFRRRNIFIDSTVGDLV